MLWFSDRNNLDKKYKEWLLTNNQNIKDSSFNVITFLFANDLLNEDKVKDFID